MSAVRLHEVRKATRTTNPRDGGHLLVPHLSLLDQFEIKREHGKITAPGAPGRVVGGEFFFGQTFAFAVRQGWNGKVTREGARAGQWNKGDGKFTHGQKRRE